MTAGWKFELLVEYDIKGLQDNDHTWMMNLQAFI